MSVKFCSVTYGIFQTPDRLATACLQRRFEFPPAERGAGRDRLHLTNPGGARELLKAAFRRGNHAALPPPKRAMLFCRAIVGDEAVANERVERRLRAILAADVAGYSRLTGVDEE